MTIEELIEIAEDNLCGMGNDGVCRACGNVQGGCEPDARNYECEACGKNEVFGAEELLLMGF